MLKLRKNDGQAVLAVLCVYIVTSAHHIYGAWLYETPWRTHIAYQGLTWLLVSYLLLGLSYFWYPRLFRWLFVVIAGFFFVLAIGFYEGAYNHLLKNVLFFSGVAEECLLTMYPPPKYELPDDLLFEVTGILTLAVSLWCLQTMIRMMRLKPNT